MPTDREVNQFRRMVGDYNTQSLATPVIFSYLNDATNELTGGFATPLYSLDDIDYEHHNEVIHMAALNWWWNRLAELEDRHSINVGSAAQNVSEKWDRAMQMITNLQQDYDEIQQLRTVIKEGNLSRWSKQTLRRVGGVSEEDV